MTRRATFTACVMAMTVAAFPFLTAMFLAVCSGLACGYYAGLRKRKGD